MVKILAMVCIIFICVIYRRLSMTPNQRKRNYCRCRERYKKVVDVLSYRYVLYIGLRVQLIMKPKKYDQLQLVSNFTTVLKEK